jgi:hypothetical protein
LVFLKARYEIGKFSECRISSWYSRSDTRTSWNNIFRITWNVDSSHIIHRHNNILFNPKHSKAVGIVLIVVGVLGNIFLVIPGIMALRYKPESVKAL